MGNMILKAATNNVGSECEADMDISREDWDKLSDEEKNQWIGECRSDVVEIWVEEEES